MSKYHATNTLKIYTMISILFGVFDILLRIGTASQRNVKYGTKRFQIEINCNDDDVNTINKERV